MIIAVIYATFAVAKRKHEKISGLYGMIFTYSLLHAKLNWLLEILRYLLFHHNNVVQSLIELTV